MQIQFQVFIIFQHFVESEIRKKSVNDKVVEIVDDSKYCSSFSSTTTTTTKHQKA